MDVDGLRAEMKLFSDVPCAFALADELEHFEFAVRQLLNRRGGASWPPGGQPLEDSRRHARADVDFAAKTLPDGGEQRLAARLLHDVAAGSGPQSAFGV